MKVCTTTPDVERHEGSSGALALWVELVCAYRTVVTLCDISHQWYCEDLFGRSQAGSCFRDASRGREVVHCARNGMAEARKTRFEALLGEVTDANEISSMVSSLNAKQQAQQSTPLAAAVSEAMAHVARPDSNEDGIECWSVAEWLGSFIALPVAHVLQMPLGTSAPPEAALAFMRTLGGDRELLRWLLSSHELIEGLVESIATAAAGLSTQQSALMLSNKFAESTFTLSFGGLDSFFQGLEGRIGPPDPNLREAMEAEHCKRRDSRELFVTANYGISTTSELEYWYVVDPTRGETVLNGLGLERWPTEAHSASGAKRRRGIKRTQTLASFGRKLMQKNTDLMAINEPVLIEDELLAGRARLPE